MKLLMAPHSGCDNRGCEAIVRGTASILDKSSEELFLYTSNTESDLSFGMDQICTLIPNNSRERTISRWNNRLFAIKDRLFGTHRDLEEISFRHKNALFDRKHTLFLSIGGDNYCYPGMQHVLSELTKLFSYQDIPGVLWGCSFEETLLTDKVVEELRYYSKIIVRESLSYELLQKKGLGQKVVLCSDPAFVLPPSPVEAYDRLLKDRQFIGINISPLMDRYNAYPDATYRNIKKLVEHILKTTDCDVLLIPHVGMRNNDDWQLNRKLLEELGNSRVASVDERLNCMQLKYIISKCKALIGCRTHATIASYSTCVPTMAVAYSTKARGIAKDIFGDTDALLADARCFQSDDDLVRLYDSFKEREDIFRQKLQKTMPGYIEHAYLAKDALKDLLRI